MSSRTRYVLTETLISVAINATLSVTFVFLIFHGRSRVAVTGTHGVVLDMAPQTFMVVLMACLIPAWLTRKRHAAGALAWHRASSPSSISRVWMRAVVLAILMTGVVVGVSWVTLPNLFPAGIGFKPFLAGKALFGMLLAASVTPWAIRKVLR